MIRRNRISSLPVPQLLVNLLVVQLLVAVVLVTIVNSIPSVDAKLLKPNRNDAKETTTTATEAEHPDPDPNEEDIYGTIV
jgi:hypothetical protein